MSADIPDGSYLFVNPDSKLKSGFYRITRVFAHDDSIGKKGRPLGIQVQVETNSLFGRQYGVFTINLSPKDAEHIAKQVSEIIKPRSPFQK